MVRVERKTRKEYVIRGLSPREMNALAKFLRFCTWGVDNQQLRNIARVKQERFFESTTQQGRKICKELLDLYEDTQSSGARLE